MIDYEKLKEALKSYSDSFAIRWTKESKKWVFVKQFSEKFNLESQNLSKMLSESIHNSALSGKISPRGMLIELSKIEPELMREGLKKLFDESKNVDERAKTFLSLCEDLKIKGNQQNGRKWGSSGQSLGSVSELLAMRYPEKYYGYRDFIIKWTIKYLNMNLDFKKNNPTKLSSSMAVFKEINDVIKKDENFVNLFKNNINKETMFEDTSLTIATADFCFYIAYNIMKKGKIENDEEKKLEATTQTNRFWWINTSPKIFSFYSVNIGDTVNFKILNSQGNRRNIPRNYDNVKVDDKVILYEATPTLKIIGIGLIEHENNNEDIGVKLIERLSNPISYSEIKNAPELMKCEALSGQRGTLFSLTDQEYTYILEIIREANPVELSKNNDKYTKKEFLEEVFMTEEMYDSLKDLLNYKMNIILQGPPGVGKTFAAERLAYSIIGEKDESCIEFIQFHQNYSYEDFILGYKPYENSFKLEEGIFTTFCRKASNNPNKKYFLIIDEINRGNMSKIFGELLMTIENSYRNKIIKLAYGNTYLKVPNNLYIIGMMNTADRSIAFIDYALRRRFGFCTIKPAFDFKLFKEKIEKFDKSVQNTIDIIIELNDAIKSDDSLGEGFCIGHSYFCQKKYIDKIALNNIINFEIIPILKEYWFDDKDTFEMWYQKLKNSIK